MSDTSTVLCTYNQQNRCTSLSSRAEIKSRDDDFPSPHESTNYSITEPHLGTTMSGAPGPSNTGKAIASLAKIPTDTTRAGTQKMKFIPTLPVRRKKE